MYVSSLIRVWVRIRVRVGILRHGPSDEHLEIVTKIIVNLITSSMLIHCGSINKTV